MREAPTSLSNRANWARLSDQQLLAQCAVDTYRASGPGGQKRNKTSSAVRLRHEPSGLIVIAEESRSQHENRARALRRLRQALYLKIRDDIPVDMLTPEALATHADYSEACAPACSPGEASKRVQNRRGEQAGAHARRLHLGRTDPRFWPAVGVVLDVLQAVEARVSDAALALGLSTGNLISFLASDPKVWEQANVLRSRFGHKPLRG